MPCRFSHSLLCCCPAKCPRPFDSLLVMFLTISPIHVSVAHTPAHALPKPDPFASTYSYGRASMSQFRSTALDTIPIRICTPIPTNLHDDSTLTPTFSRPCARGQPWHERCSLDLLYGLQTFLASHPVLVLVRAGTAVHYNAHCSTARCLNLLRRVGDSCPEPRRGVLCAVRRARRADYHCGRL